MSLADRLLRRVGLVRASRLVINVRVPSCTPEQIAEAYLPVARQLHDDLREMQERLGRKPEEEA